MPLEGKEARFLIPALREIVLKINLEFQCQAVYRVHADQAQELTGSAVKNALAENNVLVTMTAGKEPNANGRAERAIGILKQRARSMLMVFVDKSDRSELWAAAIQHASLLQRRQLQGRPVTCPFFGQEVVSRIRIPSPSAFEPRGSERHFSVSYTHLTLPTTRHV